MNDDVKSVFFTGHRNVKITPELTERLTEQLESLIKSGAIDFYAGGAVGWDMFCERAVISLRKRYPDIRLHLILPCREEEQTVKWTESEIAEYKRILSQADTVEVLSEHYYNGCMKKRNARLVELADVCICWYNEKRKATGTAQTVRMALNKNIEVINLY